MSELRLSKALEANGIEELVQEVDELVSEVHHLSHCMHSSKLDYLGLNDALAEMCRSISQLHRVTVEFQPNNVPGNLGPELSLCFYRVAQEALNNVVRHSGATQARVNLSRVGKRLMMQVADNGIGFDDRIANSGLGLASIQERMLSIRGIVSVRSSPNTGTLITVEAPLHRLKPSESDSREVIPADRTGIPGASVVKTQRVQAHRLRRPTLRGGGSPVTCDSCNSVSTGYPEQTNG